MPRRRSARNRQPANVRGSVTAPTITRRILANAAAVAKEGGVVVEIERGGVIVRVIPGVHKPETAPKAEEIVL